MRRSNAELRAERWMNAAHLKKPLIHVLDFLDGNLSLKPAQKIQEAQTLFQTWNWRANLFLDSAGEEATGWVEEEMELWKVLAHLVSRLFEDLFPRTSKNQASKEPVETAEQMSGWTRHELWERYSSILDEYNFTNYPCFRTGHPLTDSDEDCQRIDDLHELVVAIQKETERILCCAIRTIISKEYQQLNWVLIDIFLRGRYSLGYIIRYLQCMRDEGSNLLDSKAFCMA